MVRVKGLLLLDNSSNLRGSSGLYSPGLMSSKVHFRTFPLELRLLAVTAKADRSPGDQAGNDFQGRACLKSRVSSLDHHNGG